MSKPSVQDLKHILQTLKKHDTKNVDFPTIIQAFSDKQVIKYDPKHDTRLVADLKDDIEACVRAVTQNRVQSKRVNEVDNYIEQPLIDAINTSPSSLRAQRPETAMGKQKATGYPDILIFDGEDRPTYLEVKTYNPANKATTQRSFYLSPSDDFKVVHDARHFLVAFEMDNEGQFYWPKTYTLVDLHDLSCDIKFEINSDNKRLYQQCAAL